MCNFIPLNQTEQYEQQKVPVYDWYKWENAGIRRFLANAEEEKWELETLEI